DFKDIDEKRSRWKRDVEKLRKEGKKAEADALDADLAALQPRWQRARDRFDLAIEQRKTLQAKAASLPGKLEPERRLRDRLLGPASQADLEQEQRKRVEAHAAEAEVEKGWQEINAAVQRVDEAAGEERDSMDRLTELQAQLGRAQAYQITVLQVAKQSGQEA